MTLLFLADSAASQLSNSERWLVSVPQRSLDFGVVQTATNTRTHHFSKQVAVLFRFQFPFLRQTPLQPQAVAAPLCLLQTRERLTIEIKERVFSSSEKVHSGPTLATYEKGSLRA